jgi:serine/threonine protein kinase
MAARYKILEELGAGGAGAVFKAYDTQLDRYVAIKRLMSKEDSEKQDAKTGGLKKEAASLATLQHPNIVSVFDLGSDDEGFFMVMELVEGETLSDWVQATPMNLNDFRELALQSLEALITAHGQSILHRDLKPENIKIKRLPGGRIQVKVLDFGLARMSYGAKKMTEDQSGNVIGSIYYMAPEQFLRKPVDVRTDLYSLGCVFYQAVSGRRPYADETVKGVMDAHLKHLVHPLKSIAPEIPQPVSDWVMWLINAEPVHRPANADAALASLHEIINAGWFNETITSAIPVIAPDISAEGWHTTSTIPRAPTTAHVRTATGAVSQRLTSSHATRATGAVPPRPAVPSPSKPVTRVTPPEEEENKLPGWIWPTAAAAVVLIGAYFLWPSKKGGAVNQGSGANAASANAATARPLTLLIRGHVAQFVAGEKMNAWADPNKPAPPAKANDIVLNWYDLSPAAGDGVMTAYDKLKSSCPKWILEKPAGFKFPVNMLRFEPGQGMMHRMEKADPRAKEYPFGDPARSTGVTAIMLVRPQIRDHEVRCLRLRNQDGTGSLDVRAYPNNDWKLTVKAGTTAKEGKVASRNVTQFFLVGVTWNATNNKALLQIRAEDGSKGRAEFAATVPKEKFGVFNEVRLAEISKHSSAPVPPADQFSGDIVELIVWPYAMEWEERSGQEWNLVQHYFTTPGSRY